jgi:hypothetical protein
MKNIFYTVLLLLVGASASFAQSNKQVTWKYTAKKVSAGVYEVHITATLNGNWHIYAQQAGEGPLPTTFKFTKNPLLTLEGAVKEQGKLKKVHEEAFDSEVRYYENTVTFIQTVKVKGKAKTALTGTVEYMVCNDKECLPPAEVPFKVELGG